MPKYSESTREDHVEAIREVLVVNGSQVSILTIQAILKEKGLILDKDYINKLKRGIFKERLERADKASLKAELGYLSNTIDFIRPLIFEVIDDEKVKTRDRLSAVETLLKLESDLFDRKLAAGVFDDVVNNQDANNILKILSVLKTS